MANVNPLNERRPTENVPFYGAHGKSPHHSDRDRVQRAVQKFRELLSEHTKKSSIGSNKLGKKAGAGTSEVLKQMRKSFPSFFVNKTYAMLGEFGHVPGVEVGDCFGSRAELSLVGLHRPPQAGIDCKDVTFTRKDGNRELIAISLVVSGEYEDDSDQGHTIIYTGQGGKEQGAKQQSKDQKSIGGNEALRNSKVRQISIRVIRGRRVPGRTSKLFSYDGLFKVASYVFEKGQSNFKVFRFTLVRDQDQAPLLPLGQLLLKGGPGGSGEGNWCCVVAEGREAFSNGEEEATATASPATATATPPATQGACKDDVRSLEVIVSRGEDDEKGGDEDKDSILHGGDGEKGDGDSDCILNGGDGEKGGDENKDSVLNREDGEKGGQHILDEVLLQSKSIRGEEKTDFQVGELSRNVEDAIAKNDHPMKDDTIVRRRSKRLRGDMEDNVSNGEGKQLRLGVAIALEGKKQVDMDSNSKNMDDSTKQLSGERDSDDDDIKDGEFEVDYISDKTTTKPRRGKMVTKYFVVWKGYPEKEGTWESVANLTNCEKAIELFEKTLAQGRVSAE